MKFKEMQYTRPVLSEVTARLQEITEELKKAESFEEAEKAFLDFDRETRHIETMATLSSSRSAPLSRPRLSLSPGPLLLQGHRLLLPSRSP